MAQQCKEEPLFRTKLTIDKDLEAKMNLDLPTLMSPAFLPYLIPFHNHNNGDPQPETPKNGKLCSIRFDGEEEDTPCDLTRSMAIPVPSRPKRILEDF